MKATGRLDRALFAPVSAQGLGLARIAFYGSLAVFYLAAGVAEWARVDPIFWRPWWPWSLLSGMPPAWLLEAAAWSFLASLAATAAGLATRAASLVAPVAGFVALGLPNQLGRTFHTDAPVVIILALCACARLGDAWSLDRALARRLGRRFGHAATAAPPAPSGEYRWPFVAARLVVVSVFAAAGLSKLVGSGLSWATSGHVASILRKQVVSSATPFPELALALAARPRLVRLGAAAVLAFELAYPLALASRRARAVLVPLALLLLASFALVLGPSFGAYAICHLWWLPWGRIAERLAR